ncbi:DUF2267 domain-containing protein [soil metagenome]
MPIQFDEYAKRGKSFVDEIAKELGTQDTDRAGRMLRCVLRALRNRMTVEESFQLIGQLPMSIKGIYVDGWKVRMAPGKFNHIGEFRSEVMKEDDYAALKDFYYDGAVDDAIKAVFRVLSRHVSAGEMENVISVLPGELRIIIEDAPPSRR